VNIRYAIEAWVASRLSSRIERERFPIWNHAIDKESLKFKPWSMGGIENVEQLFRDAR